MQNTIPVLLPEYIQKAMRLAERRYKVNASYPRKWLKVGHADSYEDAEHRVEAWVLEGSPAKGYVVATKYWAVSYNVFGVRPKTYYAH